MRIFASLDELAGAKGEHLGHGEWHTVTQEQVNQFADATGDHQWIHVDTDKAAHGPFGTTIAHGYLTLSLIPFLGKEILRVDGISMGINYGLGKVRFPSAVPVGARLRAGVEPRAEELQAVHGLRVILAEELAGQLPQLVLVHGTYTTIVSATQAGLSLPSTSTVQRKVACLPCGRSVTSISSTPARRRAPTGTALGKRTFPRP